MNVYRRFLIKYSSDGVYDLAVVSFGVPGCNRSCTKARYYDKKTVMKTIYKNAYTLDDEIRVLITE